MIQVSSGPPEINSEFTVHILLERTQTAIERCPCEYGCDSCTRFRVTFKTRLTIVPQAYKAIFVKTQTLYRLKSAQKSSSMGFSDQWNRRGSEYCDDIDKFDCSNLRKGIKTSPVIFR